MASPKHLKPSNNRVAAVSFGSATTAALVLFGASPSAGADVLPTTDAGLGLGTGSADLITGLASGSSATGSADLITGSAGLGTGSTEIGTGSTDLGTGSAQLPGTSVLDPGLSTIGTGSTDAGNAAGAALASGSAGLGTSGSADSVAGAGHKLISTGSGTEGVFGQMGIGLTQLGNSGVFSGSSGPASGSAAMGLSGSAYGFNVVNDFLAATTTPGLQLLVTGLATGSGGSGSSDWAGEAVSSGSANLGHATFDRNEGLAYLLTGSAAVAAQDPSLADSSVLNALLNTGSNAIGSGTGSAIPESRSIAGTHDASLATGSSGTGSSDILSALLGTGSAGLGTGSAGLGSGSAGTGSSDLAGALLGGVLPGTGSGSGSAGLGSGSAEAGSHDILDVLLGTGSAGLGSGSAGLGSGSSGAGISPSGSSELASGSAALMSGSSGTGYGTGYSPLLLGGLLSPVAGHLPSAPDEPGAAGADAEGSSSTDLVMTAASNSLLGEPVSGNEVISTVAGLALTAMCSAAALARLRRWGYAT